MPDNILIEQDHLSIKLRFGPMLGFKRFRRASITIAGIELMHRIRNAQCKRGKLPSERRWIYAGAGRMRLARGGIFGPGMPRRAPMNSENDNFNFMQVLASRSMMSRASRP